MLKILLLLPFFLFSVESSMIDPSRSNRILVLGIPTAEYYASDSHEIPMSEIPSKIKPVFSGSGVVETRVLAHLGFNCALLGSIGEDLVGKAFIQSLQDEKIKPLLLNIKNATPSNIHFIQKDGSSEIKPLIRAQGERSVNLQPQDFEKLKLCHVSVSSQSDLSVINQALKLAKEKGALISLALLEYDHLKDKRKTLLGTTTSYVDLLFLNKESAKALSKGMEPMDASNYLSRYADTVIVMMGENGGWIKNKQTHFYYPGIPSKVLDRSGSNEFFTAGFLFSHLRERPLQESAWTGAYLSSLVMQEIGPEIKHPWGKIRDRIHVEEAMVLKAENSLKDIAENSSSSKK